MRSVVFRFEDITAFSDALGDAPGALPLPAGETETARDGEWVLATFEIGSRRRATAAAARVVRAAGDPHIEFERRDWDRLLGFVMARSEHMRVAKPASTMPTTTSALPAADALPPSSQPPPSDAPHSSRSPVTARVLLVDDDEGTRDAVRATLAEVGLRVEVVETAAEAKERLRDQAFDALVLDLHAPGLSPLELVRDLRRDPARAPLPVLFLADSASSRDVVDAFASGADDVLAKPFRTAELGARIIGLLRRARLSSDPRAPGPAPGGRA